MRTYSLRGRGGSGSYVRAEPAIVNCFDYFHNSFLEVISVMDRFALVVMSQYRGGLNVSIKFSSVAIRV